mgnify:CR=1 FL=1
MAKASGPAESIIIKGRTYVCDADSDVKITLSGFSNEQKMNGDGSSRSVKSREVGKVEGLTLVIDPARGDLEFLKESQDSFDQLSFTLTLCSGDVFSGEGQITDVPEFDVKEGTVEIAIHGKVERQ